MYPQNPSTWLRKAALNRITRREHLLCRARLVLTLAMLAAVLSLSATADVSARAQERGGSHMLAEEARATVFNPGGKLDMRPGASGPLNPRGLRRGDARGHALHMMPNSVPGDERWQDGFITNGTSGLGVPVNTIAVDTGGNVYAGGVFTAAGNAPANHIAKWNVTTNSWESLGSGTDFAVNAIVTDQSAILYASGDFTTAGGVWVNHVAKWDGSSWSALGSGVDGTVNALALDASGNLYAAGYFTTAGGVAVNHIAKWNGNSWSALGAGIGGISHWVNALAAKGSDLYVGGRFTTAGGVGANDIAKWDGTGWSALGDGVSGGLGVQALGVDSSGNVYAGGDFTSAGGVGVDYIAKWNGSSWSALGSGVSGSDPYIGTFVDALAIDTAGNVYAGGDFDTAGGVSANYVAKWNGSNWSALGVGTDYVVDALATDSGGNLYAGGSFATAGGKVAYNIARWNGSSWYALGSTNNSVDSDIYTIASNGLDVYVGGAFARAGMANANHVARWNAAANSWSALGTGMDGWVRALALDGSGNLYAGGDFTTAGGIAANHVAKWNGTSWSALGTGTSSGARALAVDRAGNVYAGAGSTIAEWNGSLWSVLGEVSGTQNPLWAVPFVSAIAVDGNDNVYVGGNFLAVESIPVSFVAKWDGSHWTALGTGMEGVAPLVFDFALDGNGNLYAGGQFTTAGGVSANGIAKWNGSSWSTLGTGVAGISHRVNALAAKGSDLYAGGVFTAAGGVSANNIAKWDGNSWSARGSGLSNEVNALAADDTSAIAGGSFTTAGGKVSAYFARYITAPLTFDFTKLGDKNAEIRFAPFDFSSHFDSVNGSLVKVKVTSLPDHGALRLGASNVILNQEIAAADLGNLTFTPVTDWLGTTSFDWNGSEGKQYATNGASVTMIVAILRWNYFPLIGR